MKSSRFFWSTGSYSRPEKNIRTDKIKNKSVLETILLPKEEDIVKWVLDRAAVGVIGRIQKYIQTS